jgi:shikimate kinase
MKSNKYFLVGMPASGKSTIGRLLAGQLRLDFFDLDQIIVDTENESISNIFAKKGEAYFRELERKCLIDFIQKEEKYILATGGGAPCFFDNMDLMNRHGVTVFLDVDIMDLYHKLSLKTTHKRPLLQGKSKEELKKELMTKYEGRKPFYDLADICLKQRLDEVNDRVNQVIFAIKTLEK